MENFLSKLFIFVVYKHLKNYNKILIENHFVTWLSLWHSMSFWCCCCCLQWYDKILITQLFDEVAICVYFSNEKHLEEQNIFCCDENCLLLPKIGIWYFSGFSWEGFSKKVSQTSLIISYFWTFHFFDKKSQIIFTNEHF